MKKLNVSKLGLVVMTGVTLSASATPHSQIIREELFERSYSASPHKQEAINLGNSWLSDSTVQPESLTAYSKALTSSAMLGKEAQIETVPAVTLKENVEAHNTAKKAVETEKASGFTSWFWTGLTSFVSWVQSHLVFVR